MPKKTTNSNPKQKDHYAGYDYTSYWDNRDYEHEAEQIAISRLLKGKKFKKAADVGGAYGRNCIVLTNFADEVTLAEPSKTQLDEAKTYLADYPQIKRKQMQADDLKFKDGELDLIIMIRVMHHLPEPEKEFAELARVLSNDGTMILEVANYAHFRNRVKHLLKGKPLPKQQVDIRKKGSDGIPFSNHNPKTVKALLDENGLEVEKTLSVSNLRSPKLKKLLPKKLMLAIEKSSQPALASSYFGPSIFFSVRRKK